MARPRTFTENARRAQLVAVTSDLVVTHGRRSLSLQRIADAAGVSKAAVLYYFPSKDAVLAAAYRTVADELVSSVGEAVDAAPDAATGVLAYLDALLSFLAADLRRPRLLVEALGAEDPAVTDDHPAAARRWTALTALVRTAQEAGTVRADLDPKLSAIMLGGIVDAVVAASLEDSTVRIDDARPGVLRFARHALGIAPG